MARYERREAELGRYQRWLAAGCPQDAPEEDRAPFDTRQRPYEAPRRSQRWAQPVEDFIPPHVPFDTRATGYPLQARKDDSK